MTTLLDHDLTFQSPPRISQALFVAILSRNHSPAAVEAGVLYQTPGLFGLDPAIALAFFHHESSYGTQGAALATRNWGNLRRGQGHSIGMLNGFATYRTWADSLRDWCSLISTSYVLARRLTTVRAALQVYAPSSDGNAPARYADSVMADIARWRAEDAAPPSTATAYRVKASVTTDVRIRSAPRANASVLGVLHAGDVWQGTPISGSSTTVAGFGTSATWVRSDDMRYVWANLLEEIPIRG